MKELHKVPFFEHFSESTLAALLACRNYRKEYRKGDVVVYHGDELETLLVLIQGSVKTYMYSQEGDEVVSGHIHAPNFIAPGILYADDRRMPVEVRASSHCTIWHFDGNDFYHFLFRHSQGMHTFLKAVSNDSHILAESVYHYSTLSMRQRVISHLDEYGFIDNITHLAQQFAVSRPSLSRLLSEMQREGTLVREGHRLVRPHQ